MRLRNFVVALCAVLPLAADELPSGVRAVWDLAKAGREATATRERVSVNGLWRWQPASDAGAAGVPADGWGYLRVPESWPRGSRRGPEAQLFYPHSSWKSASLSGVTAAWYQREITVPREWTGRRIALYAEYVNSYATVYVDGVKAGEIRYPAGEIDLTAACRPGRTHVLSMLVAAMPLKAVMLSYKDTAAAKEVAGKVERRGLCGDVYLLSTPAGPRITDVKIETSVRRWEITLSAALDGGAGRGPAPRYVLRARINDGSRRVAEFTSQPFGSRDPADGRITFTEPWRPEKLWDTRTPQNQYVLSLSLVDARGNALDTALPVRFGFREFWIDGRDFYLNGTRIYLSAIPLDNAQLGAAMASYDATRATLQRFKSFGINFVYTHNYGCEPGAHLSFEEVLRAADDEGVLLAFSQPHFSHYDWTASDADSTNGYARHAEFYVRAAQNHPAVVCYSTSHNSTGYGEDMNPDMIDGVQAPRETWGARNAARAVRAEAIIRRLDASRIVYHHASGNLGPMHVDNFYGNWIPIQEMSDWLEHWATTGVKPFFTCEYSVPFLWDWSMYRGWYKGKREFGSAVVPWEFAVAEWDAQFLGDRAYQITEAEKVNLRWEAEQFRKGRTWYRWDYPENLNSQAFDDRFRVISMYLTDNWRAFRTWGLSANSPWEYASYWKQPSRGRDREEACLHCGDKPLAVDWDRLQRPGPRPVYVREDEARERLAFHPPDYQPTAAAEALYRNNMPLLAYIAGKPAAFTSKDHNFLVGETVEKQVVVINNSRETVTVESPQSSVFSHQKFNLPTGEQKRIPLTLHLSETARRELHASVKFGNGTTQEDSFTIHVFPRPAPVHITAKIALFDPKGGTAKLLDGMGVRYERVDANANLAAYGVFIAGKGSLTLDGAAPDISRVRDGLKVIVFEQTGEVLEKRFGFRVAEYGLRCVFKRVPDQPLLKDLAEEHFRDWRGEATSLPPRLSYELAAKFNYVPTVKWCDIPVTRVWRAGNRGSVASVLIEKPARGDFLPVLDGGFSLQYSPLIEYREGNGMVLFCQMDVTGRTEPDPAADVLARNILRYAADWKPPVRRNVSYAGDGAGKSYLESAGLSPASYEGEDLATGRLLVVGPTGGMRLQASAARIAAWMKRGGRVLAMGLDEKDANAFLPFRVTTPVQEHIAAYFAPFAAASVFAGISPAEVHNRDPRKMPLVATGATVVGDGVLATADGGHVIFSQLAPWQFDYSGEKMNVKRTFRRVACLTARLLANLGAASRTPLIPRFATPVRANEKRWLDGFYLDVPEEWDDPYRFFRW